MGINLKTQNISTIPHIKSVYNNIDISPAIKPAHYISAIIQDIFYNLGRLYNYFFSKKTPLLEKDTSKTLWDSKKITLVLGSLALGGMSYYLGANPAIAIAPVVAALSFLSYESSTTPNASTTSHRPFFTKSNYQAPPGFSSLEASHNQFNIRGRLSKPQSCASNALTFLNESFRLRRCARNLDSILRNGADYDSRARRLHNLRDNIGLTYDELEEFHRENSPLRHLSLTQNEVGINFIPGNGPIDFQNFLFEELEYECGFLIYKGGATYALYKNGNKFYFSDSHGFIKNNSATPAYVIESSNLNDLLNGIPMLSRKGFFLRYNQQISIYKIPKNH